MRTYNRNQHRFFDDLISYLSSFASFGMAIEAHNFGFRPAFKPTEHIVLMGMPHVTNTVLTYSPYSILQPIASNGWPNVIEFQENPPDFKADNLKKFPIILTGISALYSLAMEASFMHYYETILPLIEARFSKEVTKWPTVLNFARVIRNAFAHDGRINFSNPKAQPVNWKSLTYSPSDNGHLILHQDLAEVEVIFLMEDMNSTL